MMRLAFSDLRDHAATWIGAFVIAVACGYIGGWVACLQATAALYADPLQRNLQNAGTMVLMFSLVAAVAVLVSASNLTVSAQRRSYALWQLANASPRSVSAVVLVQLVAVALFGAVVGTLLAAITIEPLFPLVFSSRAEDVAQAAPQAAGALTPAVWLAVSAVFLCGGMKGARSAGATSPMVALRDPEPKRMGMTWVRAGLFAGLLGCTCWVSACMIGAGRDAAFSWSMYVPLLVVATMVPLAPLVFSTLLRAWTRLVPQKRWNAWYLARHTARYGLAVSASVETPVMVGVGLAAGIFSVVACGEAYLEGQGMTYFNGFDVTTTLLLLGGPMLLCALGAAVSVVMSSRSRTRDVALLSAVGARPATLVAAAVCEAFIHTATATLAGIAAVVASNAVVNYAYGQPFFVGLSLGQGIVVSLVGFALILVATLLPTCAALGRETATVLSVQE